MRHEGVKMAILDFQAAMGCYQGSARILVWSTNGLRNKRVLIRFQARAAMFSKNGLEHRIRERPCVKAIEQYWDPAFATLLLVYGHGSRIRTLADYRCWPALRAHTAMLLSESIVNMLFLLCRLLRS
jgi:hypothetical protein